MTQKCIICNSKKIYNYTPVVKNRYTEEFSKLLKLTTEELEKKYSNVICKNCGFVFKKKWFSKKILKKVYTKLVSSHPRGWDTISKKFNPSYLKNQLSCLLHILKKCILPNLCSIFILKAKLIVLGLSVLAKFFINLNIFHARLYFI